MTGKTVLPVRGLAGVHLVQVGADGAWPQEGAGVGAVHHVGALVCVCGPGSGYEQPEAEFRRVEAGEFAVALGPLA